MDHKRVYCGRCSHLVHIRQTLRNRVVCGKLLPFVCHQCLDRVKVLEQESKQAIQANPGDDYRGRNKRLRELGFRDYKEYLKSDWWKAIRQLVYAKKGRTCAMCSAPAVDLHHTRYFRDDLVGACLDHIHPLCRRCHAMIEFDESGNKSTVIEAAIEFHRRKHAVYRVQNIPLAEKLAKERREARENKNRRKARRQRRAKAWEAKHAAKKAAEVKA